MKARTFVRIPCCSHRDAKELALCLRADGYRVSRRWKLLIAGTDTPVPLRILAPRGAEFTRFRTEYSLSERTCCSLNPFSIKAFRMPRRF